MKTLIIGATGLLARPVIQEMLKRGHTLRLFSRSASAKDFPEQTEVIRGDVFNTDDLGKAIQGCDAIHITIGRTAETPAMQNILSIAKQENIRLISYVSGNTVREENRWFPMMDDKFRAEQLLIQSGIPYLIFRATWFFESLSYMIRGNRATILGKQPHAYHWLAASDFAKMIANGYENKDAWNKVHYTLGREPATIEEMLEKYCAALRPDIRQVKSVPIGILKVMAFLSRNKPLKFAADLFAYFSKTPEYPKAGYEDELIGKAATSFDDWISIQKSK